MFNGFIYRKKPIKGATDETREEERRKKK